MALPLLVSVLVVATADHVLAQDNTTDPCIPLSCLSGVVRKAACGLALQHDPVHNQLGVELTEAAAASKKKTDKAVWCGEMVGSIVAERADVAAMAACRILDLPVGKGEDPIQVITNEANKHAKKKSAKKIISRAQAAMYLVNAIKTGSFQSAAMQAATVFGHTEEQGPAATEIMQYKEAHHPLHIISTTAGIICNNGQGVLPRLEHGGDTCATPGELQHTLKKVRNSKKVYKKKGSKTRGLNLGNVRRFHFLSDPWAGKGEIGK